MGEGRRKEGDARQTEAADHEPGTCTNTHTRVCAKAEEAWLEAIADSLSISFTIFHDTKRSEEETMAYQQQPGEGCECPVFWSWSGSERVVAVDNWIALAVSLMIHAALPHLG